MRKRRFISLMALMAVLMILVMVVGLPIVALATDGEVVTEYPWDNVAVLGISWGALVSVLISILKIPQIGLKPELAPAVTWIFGFVGLVVYGLFNGQPLMMALLSGLTAVVSAPGFYEAFSKPLGKKLSGSSGSA